MRKIIFISFCAVWVSCKRNYTCVCSNIGGVVKKEEIHDTKKQATKKCNALSEQYQNTPFSEAGCVLTK